MPDDPINDEPIEPSEGVHEPDAAEALYDAPEQPSEADQQMADLQMALQPSEEDYLPFDNDPPPPQMQRPEVQDELQPDKPVEFDPRWREEFEGLLYLGFLKKRFTWLGHRYVIRSLGTDAVLEVALIQKPYVGTMGDIKAYQAACVAACLISVDGKPMPVPVSDDPSETDLEAKFEYVTKRYSPIVIDVIYGQLMELEQKVNEVLAAMGKASG